MEYYIMLSSRYKNARTGEDYMSHSFHNGTMFGMMSFGSISSAVKYPNKRVANQANKGHRNTSVISVSDATQLVLNKSMNK